MAHSDLIVGEDGLARPAWAATDPLLQAYYDTEWGMPVRDERGVFERLTLEAFQSGLSWATILRKRPAFRAAFDDFHPEVVAAYGDSDVARLMADAAIVRNRRKIDANPGSAGASRGPDAVGRVARPVQSLESQGLCSCRTDHDVCPDGGDRHRRHSPARQPPPRDVRSVGLSCRLADC